MTVTDLGITESTSGKGDTELVLAKLLWMKRTTRAPMMRRLSSDHAFQPVSPLISKARNMMSRMRKTMRGKLI